MIISSKNKFYISLFFELILSPWLYFINFYKWNLGNCKNLIFTNKIRIPVLTNKLAVCIHEWGGYKGIRVKKIKNIKEFECGLNYQLNRYKDYIGKYELDLTVTISESNLLDSRVFHSKVLEVSNEGMDFMGYYHFFQTIKKNENQYVILTNSSVNKLDVDFIDEYIDFFKNNETVGMLGISYNSKMQQTLIKNNFNPHLQSFFLLTTTEVINEVVRYNNGFPGKGVNHKLSLIRDGEIKFSKIVIDLGYKLVCILENGKPLFFDKSCLTDNGKNTWKSFFGDYRLFVKNPNSINKLKLD